MKTATKTLTTASVELDDCLIEVSGYLGEWEWKTTLSFPKAPQITERTWVEDRTWLDDNEEVEAYLWGEVLRIFQKYNSASIRTEEVEVEVEDEEE